MYLSVDAGTCQSSLTKTRERSRFPSKAVLWSLSSFYCHPLPPATPTILQYYCPPIAQYTPRRRPSLCMPYTIQY